MLCKRLIVVFLLTLSLGLTGCSDDDPATPPGSVDETAPLVLQITPEGGSQGIALDAALVIRFSEAMDPASDAGAVTLSAGSIVDAVWSEGNTLLTVSHSAWSEGATVTATVAATVTDVAGNALVQSFASTFYTWSSVPVMLDVDYGGDPEALPLNSDPTVRFSEMMDLLSVYNATVITEAPAVTKTVPPFQVGYLQGDPYTVQFRFLADLTPLTTYTITIGTDAQTSGGTNLSAPVIVSFTTGATADETPPYILSTVPAVDAVVGTDLAVVTITFSEPLQTEDLRPREMAALFEALVTRDPVWNDARDQMTVYLTGPLPEGIRYYAIFDEYQLQDRAGNYNLEPDSLSFTTTGTAELWPTRQDLRIYYYAGGDGPSTIARQMTENVSGNNFQRVLTRLDEDGFTDEDERWNMRKDGASRQLLGFVESEGTVTFASPVNYLPVPVPATWEGSTTLNQGDQTAVLAYSGELLETGRVTLIMDKAAPAYTSLHFDNCVTVQLVHTLTASGASGPFEVGTDEAIYCPGLGLISMESYGAEYDGEVETGSWESSLWILGAALDDHLEAEFRR